VALKDSRFVAQEMDEILQETYSVLTELRSRLTQCGEDLETEFNNVRSILTPSQSAKFLVWVAQNKACMHMLNELWSKVYPDGGGRASDGMSLMSGEVSP
jgi:predicted DsbA family dithiol-disulfide isomerase